MLMIDSGSAGMPLENTVPCLFLNHIPAPGILNLSVLNTPPKYSTYSMSLLSIVELYDHFVLKQNLPTYKF